jgi:predicted MFS family arabinose efflux permease
LAASVHALDWLNFVAADVRDGVGPFLAIYLMVGRHWEPAAIGLAMSAMGIAAIAAQTPAGALVDRLRSKRALIVVASLAVAAGCLSIVHASTFGAAASNAMSGVIVQQAGYHGAFLTLAAIAGVAALWLALMMPETRAR